MAYLSVSYEAFLHSTETTDEDQLAQQQEQGHTPLWTVNTPAPRRRHAIMYIAERMSIKEAKEHCQKSLEASWRRLHPKCEIEITGFSVLPDEINADS